MMRFKTIIAVAVILVAIGTVGVSFGASSLFKELAAIGGITLSQELDIDDIRIVGADKIRVEVTSNDLTVSDKGYLGILRINDQLVVGGASIVSFTDAEIPLTTKTVDLPFDLTGAQDINVEFQGQ